MKMNPTLRREIGVALIRGAFGRLYSIFPEFRGLTRMELRALIGR